MASTPLSVPASEQPNNPRSFEIAAFFMANAVIGDDSMRFRQLDRYDAHYNCTQYKHLVHDWWGKNADANETISPTVQVPTGWEQPMVGLDVRAKRPTAPLNLTPAVVNRFTGLLFSEDRHPSIAVEGDSDTESFLNAAMESCSFWSKLRQARNMGGAVGSVLVTVGLRNGEFSLEIHNPKHITILWRDKRRLLPEAILKMYTYVEYEDIIDEKTRERTGVREVRYLYRRIISEHSDIVYVPVRLDDTRALSQHDWEVENEVKHNLGFFPGVWAQNTPVTEEFDGHPDCHGGWHLLDTIDRIYSQVIKGVLLNLDPTLVVSTDPKVAAQQGGIRKGSDNALSVGVGGSASYLEISGTGVDAGIKTITGLRQAFLDEVRCVIIDPQTISGSAQSAKAIELIYAPMLEKADELRAQWKEQCIIPLLKLIEKIGRHFSDGNYQFKLPPKIVEGPDGEPQYEEHKLGPGGYLQCNWGPYFAPTEQDDKQRIENAVSAKSGGLIDHLGAIKHTASIFGVRNPKEVARVVEDEQQQDANLAMAGMGAQVPFDSGEPPAKEPEGGDKGPPVGAGGKP